jgi:mono/diheme cytochrome c family protein
MARTITTIAVAAALAVLSAPAQANGDEQLAAGRAFVEDNCARCHAIDRNGISPLEPAPPLRELAQRYPLEGLEEAFAEGIVVGHPAMPEFELEPQQIGELMAYLQWLSDLDASTGSLDADQGSSSDYPTE